MSVSRIVSKGASAGDSAVAERLGRYELLAPLGQGGMGTLQLALANGLGEFSKLVVLKELRSDLPFHGGFIEMFSAEARVAALMNHPNIVQTLEAGQDGDRYFIAMEFLDGQPFHELLKLAGIEPRVPLQLLIQVLCEVLAGLHYAHELQAFDDVPLQIVHRDVSPQNVFVTYHGQIKILDFGIAKAADAEHSTRAGVFKGKFAYAAPEQVMGRAVDRRADVYSVGVMLWEVLAGRRFAPGSVTEAALDARLAGSEPRISQLVPTIPAELARISDRALQVDPAQRYPTAEAFRADLARYLLALGEPMQAVQIGALMRQKFAAKRAAMHQMIRTRSKHLIGQQTDGSPSLVSSLTKGIRATTDENTQVGNLTPWIERSRTDNPIANAAVHAPESVPPSSQRSNVIWLLTTAIALVATSYLWLWPRAEEPRAVPLPPSAAPITTMSAATNAPRTAPAATPTASDEAAAAGHEALAADRQARTTRKRRDAHAPGASSLASPNALPASRTSALPGSRMPGVSEPMRESRLPATNAVEVGSDLRARRRALRPIDEENPY